MMIFRPNTLAIRAMLSSIVVFLFVSLLLVETLSADTRYRVKSSDNVNTIVEQFYPNSELSRGQLLVGILIKNPRAFKGGNINFLLSGKRLTLPEEKYFQDISRDKASKLLSEHARFFRFGIAGNLPVPTFSKMKSGPEELKAPHSNDILVKQKSQTKKIDQLQQQSKELKKQLEVLLNEKNQRDERLLEIEKSLKRSLSTNKKQSETNAPEKALGLEKKSNSLLQQALNKTKSKLIENPKSNTDLEQKIENLKKVSDDQNNSAITEGNDKQDKQIILKPSTNVLLILTWLLPVIMLVLLLYYFIGKKKNASQNDDAVKVNDAGYIEPNEGDVAAFQNSFDELEEVSLETSVKLDVARAYIEAEDKQSALDILTEIMEEGSDEQKQQAHVLLEEISA